MTFTEYREEVEKELKKTNFFKIIELGDRVVGVTNTFDCLTDSLQKAWEGELPPELAAICIYEGMMSAFRATIMRSILNDVQGRVN